MAGSLKWNGPQVMALITAELSRRLGACAILVASRARVLLSVAGTGGGTGKKRTYGSNPSAPGEPPHKQYGHLRRSVAWELAGLVARVGTNLDYGRWLELGTSRVAARPWLRRALAECKTQIEAILYREI